MNWNEFATKYLVDRGMFPEQAAKVLEIVKIRHPEMNDRWGDGVDGYPDVMINVVTISLKQTGLEWINHNLPMAWYRPMFAE